MIPKEIIIQNQILNGLIKLDIYPFSVIFTTIDKENLLSITFFLNQELKELLDFLNYKNLCDNSGYLILNENNTIIFTGIALMNLINKLK